MSWRGERKGFYDNINYIQQKYWKRKKGKQQDVDSNAAISQFSEI